MAWIYAVKKGKAPGLYYDKDVYEQQVNGFPGAEGRRFQDEEEAKRYLAGETIVKKGIYAVRKGRAPGIYMSAAECEAQVRGFNGAESQRFRTIEQAQAYMQGMPASKAIRMLRPAQEQAQRSGAQTQSSQTPQAAQGAHGTQSRRETQPLPSTQSKQPAQATRDTQTKSPSRRMDAPRKRPLKRHQFVRTPHMYGKEKPHPGAHSTLIPTAGEKFKSSFQPIMVYTDGGCLVHEDGAGGYAAVICLPNGNRKEISGGVDMTRSDRMELLAAVAALRALESFAARGERVQVYTDSQYLYQGVTKKIWTTWSESEAKTYLNNDLWHELAELTALYNIVWFWVKGHNGNPMNERCDWLATDAAKRAVAEKQWVPDYAAQLETAKNRIKELERVNKKLASDADRFRLLAEDRISVSDQDLFRAVYNESFTSFLRWKLKRWFDRRRS